VAPWSRVRRILPLFALALIGAAHALRLALLRRHAFNPDEFQHLHGAWCIAKGLLPYRDYFEHHTPWLHFFIAAFLPFFDVDTSPAAAEAFIFFARGWMWVFSGLALALTFWLGRLWSGETVAWTAILLLGTSVMFLDKTLEVRPDVPAVAFLLASWTSLLRAFRGPDERRSRLSFAQSGFLLGSAFLCTQKALFTVPATLALLAWYLLGRPGSIPRAHRLKHLLWYAVGGVLPVCLVLALFAANGALTAFLRYNLLVNLRWPVRFSPEPLLGGLFHDNALMAWSGLAGFLGTVIGLFRDDALRSGRALLALQAAGLIVGLFLIPVPYAQYLVMLLPLWALFAAGMLVQTVSAASKVRPRPVRLASLSVLTVLVVGLSLRPVRTIAGMLRPAHTKVADHLVRLRYILENSGPQDIVMDGFSGLGVFRPHAFFYFFLHDEIRALLEGREMTRLLGRLRDGLIAPAWLVRDDDLDGLPREIVAFFEQNYERADVRPFWRRKRWGAAGQWLDLGEGPTDVLAGQGWYAPQREGARTFRAGRGRRSSIRLPVNHPAPCRRIVLRVRPEYPTPVAAVSVAVNGAPVGSLRLWPGWRDYTVELPRALLRGGMNTLELIYDPVPKEVDPSYPGRDALAAVDGVRLECDPG
jgi:hypothetical protein